MYKNLLPGAIAIQGLSLPAAIDLARQTGFEGVDVNIREVADLVDRHGAAYVQDLFQQAGIRPGSWGLPVAYRGDSWQEELVQLPRYAQAGQAIGAVRAGSGFSPGSDERPYAENFSWHVERLRPIARVLQENGCRLGFEFIGPKTVRAKFKYEFVYDMQGALQLIQAIGTGNVGLVLDAWHLLSAGGTIAQMSTLTAADVVAVHVNDAPPNIPWDEQIDTVRHLPLETGVMDIKGFMAQLVRMAYDGPVAAEPFSQRVNAIADPLERARVTAASLDALWQASGLA